MLNKIIENYHIVLASGSPRRKELLSAMDFSFDIVTKPVDEVFLTGLSPSQTAASLSLLKVEAFDENELEENMLIITADTIIALEYEIIGKPKNRENAFTILRKLSGKKHEVITGVSLRKKGKTITFTVSTTVYFKKLEEDEIIYYINNYQPYDKAGAYGIQEWIGQVGIKKIEGSYFNVMGLPTHRLYEELLKFVK